MKFVGRIFAYKQDYSVTREVRVMVVLKARTRPY